MELLLLGTAAAEGWPAPYCVCTHCEEARRRGGPNLRARSGALIDDDFKIDHSADTVLHMQRCGRSLAGIRTLVFTHQHSDHIMPPELRWLFPPFTQTPPSQPIAIYGNKQVLSLLHEEMTASVQMKQYVELHRLEALQPVMTSMGDEILPVPADHVEGALLLRITRHRGHGKQGGQEQGSQGQGGQGEGGQKFGGKTLFYGHDSGLYPPATLDALGTGPPLDIALLDCTSGGQKTSNRGHMGVDGVVQMTEELRRRGAVTDDTRVIATHFSHNGGLLHEELVAALLPHGIEAAFDGMVVRV